MVILQSKKHVFWQALFVTILVFSLGIVIGIYFEQMRVDESNILFYESEIALFDAFALSKLPEAGNFSCDNLVGANLKFADRIYNEARVLEKYDESSKITQSLKSIHRKYDLLRTILWMNVIDVEGECNIDSVVYFYVYDTEDIGVKSEQVVFSRVLRDLKEDKGGELILIPIAVDSEISSLDYLLDVYGVDEFPSILVNEEHLITNISSKEEIEKYLE